MNRYILALDQGTTSSRTVLFDSKGNIQGIAQKETEQIYPKHGWVEQNAEEIYQTQLETMHTVMRDHDLSYADIACIGITNQRETTVVWNKKNGEPVYNAIVWQDQRTTEFTETLKARGAEQLSRRLRTLYKSLEVDDRAIDDLVALRDETMKLKAEEKLKRLEEEADNVSVRRKVGGLPDQLSIFELGFAGKGRIYYTRGDAQRFRILAIGAPAYALGMIVTQAINGSGDTGPPTAIDFVGFWLVQIPLAYWLATSMSLEQNGAFWAITIAETLVTILGVVVFRSGRWKRMIA